MCSEIDLSQVCPAGTSIKFNANAESSCKEATDFNLMVNDPKSGAIQFDDSSVCMGEGNCLVECNISITCDAGFAIFTKDEIRCYQGNSI